MPENYILLERTELNDTAASVTFANIPQTGYTDLKIVVSARGSSAGINAVLQGIFNGSSAANYNWRQIQGNGSSATSSSVSSGTFLRLGYVPDTATTANTFLNAEIYIPNYLSSNAKSVSSDVVQENNSGTAGEALVHLIAGLWTLTSAITSITLNLASGSFLANSTFSLYGIAALGTTPAIAPKAIGGNRIDNDGTYWYHTFTSSGTFTPQTGLTADTIVIGAGGSGGGDVGGGAGAGRVYGLTSLAMASATNYVCTIGAGGASPAGNAFGTKGTDSSLIGGLLSYTSLGGGGGNGRTGAAANDGWSGGGGSYNNSTATAGNGGFSGGNTYQPSTNPSRCGGGGGSGGAAANATSAGGPGGAGTSTYSSWASATNTGVSGAYAGGGGGGQYGDPAQQAAGGSGGGGIGGGQYANGGAGTANTGSGGGGAGSGYIGGAGGSGIVIIRYPIA
jgi:hypothetical protein